MAAPPALLRSARGPARLSQPSSPRRRRSTAPARRTPPRDGCTTTQSFDIYAIPSGYEDGSRTSSRGACRGRRRTSTPLRPRPRRPPGRDARVPAPDVGRAAEGVPQRRHALGADQARRLRLRHAGRECRPLARRRLLRLLNRTPAERTVNGGPRSPSGGLSYSAVKKSVNPFPKRYQASRFGVLRGTWTREEDPEMSAAEIQITDTENEKVERWRVEALERAGYDPTAAARARRAHRRRSARGDRADRARLHARARAPHPALTRRRARAAPRRHAAPVPTQGRRARGRIPWSCRPCSPRSPRRAHGAFDLGPLTIHMYGLTLLVAILACVWLTAVRWRSVGGDPDLVLRVAVWGVAAGVVGARALPRPHLVERGADAEVEGRLRGLERRPRRLGRDPARDARRRAGRPARRRVGDAVDGRGRAGPAARAGDRPDRQLVEPGALRQADRPAVGPRDRRRAPRRAVPRQRDVPPDVPLRADLGPRRRRAADLGRPALPRSGRRRCSRSTSPTTASAASSRSCCASTRARVRAAAAERLGLDRPLRRLDRVLHLVAGARPRRRARPRRERRRRGVRRGATTPRAPKMAVPKGRVRGHG